MSEELDSEIAAVDEEIRKIEEEEAERKAKIKRMKESLRKNKRLLQEDSDWDITQEPIGIVHNEFPDFLNKLLCKGCDRKWCSDGLCEDIVEQIKKGYDYELSLEDEEDWKEIETSYYIDEYWLIKTRVILHKPSGRYFAFCNGEHPYTLKEEHDGDDMDLPDFLTELENLVYEVKPINCVKYVPLD